MTQFEWDEAKSESNLANHGIDFAESRFLWDDCDRVEFRLEHSGEQRLGLLSRYAGSVWFAVFVKRGPSVRIISVRRAVGKEVSLYDKVNSNR